MDKRGERKRILQLLASHKPFTVLSDSAFGHLTVCCFYGGVPVFSFELDARSCDLLWNAASCKIFCVVHDWCCKPGP